MQVNPTAGQGMNRGLSESALMEQVQVSLLKKTMAQEEENMQLLLKVMPPLNPPHLGNKLDVIA